MTSLHPGRAIAAGVGNALAFVVLPLALIWLVPTVLPPEIGPGLATELEGLKPLVFLLGSVVTGLAALTALFGQGLRARAVFGAGRQTGRLAWVHYVLQGGVWVLNAEGVFLSVDFLRLLYLVYASILLMAVYFGAEYLVHRPDAGGPVPAYYEPG